MTDTAGPAVTLESMLAELPRNWGRWGDDDEVGCLNYLTPEEVLRGVQHVRSGKVFTLGIPIGCPGGDPVWPGRSGATRLMTQDRSHYTAGKLEPLKGGLEYADDYITAFLQGSSQYDALGHTWYGEQIYNGFSAETTTGGMARCGVDKIAQRGVVGRGVLVDMARHRGKAFSPELVRWFHEREIVSLSTDTIANEVTVEPETGVVLPLHAALMRNLGVLFSEILWFEELAADCVQDGQWAFLYAAAPMHVVGGTGAPVNPVVIK